MTWDFSGKSSSALPVLAVTCVITLRTARTSGRLRPPALPRPPSFRGSVLESRHADTPTRKRLGAPQAALPSSPRSVAWPLPGDLSQPCSRAGAKRQWTQRCPRSSAPPARGLPAPTRVVPARLCGRLGLGLRRRRGERVRRARSEPRVTRPALPSGWGRSPCGLGAAGAWAGRGTAGLLQTAWAPRREEVVSKSGSLRSSGVGGRE